MYSRKWRHKGACWGRGKNAGYVTCYTRREIDRCVLADPQLPSPAPEILDYLARNPQAQGTIDDFYWWVLDASIRNWAPNIAKAVAQLVALDFLEEKPSPDGKIFYHISPRYLASLQQTPVRNSTPDATP
jgi:hypothetical protein